MKRIFLACISFATFGLTAPVQAIPAVTGDLILGFRASDAPGSNVNLEINLGPAANFVNMAAGSTSVLTGLAVADLVEVYGANWNSRADLSWGIVGTTGTDTVGTAPPRTIWASAPQTTPGTKSEPWPVSGAGGLQNASNTVATMYSGPTGSLVNFPATSNSATGAKVNATLAGSWTIQEDQTAGVSFRRFNPTVRMSANAFPTAGSAYDGTGYSVLDLWEIRPGTSGDPGTHVGGFGLNSAGKLVFSKDVTKFASGTTGPVELGIPTIVRNAGGTITVGLTGAPDGSYILQRSPSMADGSWVDLLTPQSPASGTLSFTDNSPLPLRGFYRIKKSA
ncbi:MAG TPA: hypothetical protein VG796_26100 [Verrucomicrobiales bacterium]|jgi:hypothetical protein|nr:hypothetical protein [Verrucomicrobiales bacterium]